MVRHYGFHRRAPCSGASLAILPAQAILGPRSGGQINPCPAGRAAPRAKAGAALLPPQTGPRQRRMASRDPHKGQHAHQQQQHQQRHSPLPPAGSAQDIDDPALALFQQNRHAVHIGTGLGRIGHRPQGDRVGQAGPRYHLALRIGRIDGVLPHIGRHRGVRHGRSPRGRPRHRPQRPARRGIGAPIPPKVVVRTFRLSRSG